MSLSKARTTISDVREFTQNHRSDVVFGLLCFQTVLLLIIMVTVLVHGDAASTRKDNRIQELGGKANYDRYKEIIASDAYRQQQTFLIDQKHKIFFPDEEEEVILESLSGSTVE